MLKFKGADPRSWGVLFDQSLALVMERHKAPNQRGSRSEALAPGRSSAEPPADPSKLAGRARVHALYGRRR